MEFCEEAEDGVGDDKVASNEENVMGDDGFATVVR